MRTWKVRAEAVRPRQRCRVSGDGPKGEELQFRVILISRPGLVALENPYRKRLSAFDPNRKGQYFCTRLIPVFKPALSRQGRTRCKEPPQMRGLGLALTYHFSKENKK